MYFKYARNPFIVKHGLMDNIIKTLGFRDSYYGLLVYKFGMVQQMDESIDWGNKG